MADTLSSSERERYRRHLALEVREIDPVAVEQTKRAATGGGQVQRRR